ncbi:MAG: YfcC family protein, partial [Bacteroidales bacterium]|nr:YfcC family protein [Bacteroidales bacterium]
MTRPRKRAFPNTYVIVFFVIIFAAILTWFVPGGTFDRQTIVVNGVERQVINPESFNFTGNEPQTWEIFSALFDGFVDKADIIVFILLIGGAFWIMNRTKAIDMGIYAFLRFTKRMEHNRFLR